MTTNEELGDVLVPLAVLRQWVKQAQAAHVQANNYSADYVMRKPGIVQDLQRMVERQGGGDFALRQAVKDNWTLNDLQDAYTWHRREENRLNAAITAQVMLRQLIQQENAS